MLRFQFIAAVLLVAISAVTGAAFDAIPQSSPGHGSVVVAVSPSSATLTSSGAQLFTATVLGQTNQAVTWSINPPIGAISSSGIYTAPPVVSATQSVIVTATSVASPMQSASALVTLAPLVEVSISPPSGTAAQSGTLQFTSVVSGSQDTSVTWSLNPAVGSISAAGRYTAPATLDSAQTIALTATSVADPSKSATASILLSPVVSVSLSPASTTVTASGSVQVYPTVKGTSNPSLNWSLDPAVGNISSTGLYTAPAIVTSPQTVTVFASSVADPTKFASVTLSLEPSVKIALNVNSVTLGPSQFQQFIATVTGSTNPSVSWNISPAVGTISASGLYTAPASIGSPQAVTVTATSAADSTQSVSATVTLLPPAGLPPTSPITLPVEVIGPDGYTASLPINLPAVPSGSQQLSLRIHGLRFDTQASVDVNGSGFLPISNSTVTVQGLGAAFGGIGGGFSTVSMILNLPAGSIVPGKNTITFRFNGTDGRVSGFRVLDLNILAGGSTLLPSSSFVYEDPSVWRAPSTLASDIAAGQTLWRTASLTVPQPGGTTAPIQAHCMDCHAQDGRDLKYFNYSNNSIRVRSIFHGLTAAQGDQIASYIRTLPVIPPPNARPWNPPYQPGPGLDSQPVQNWAAGAGIDAVLPDDASMLAFLAPGGSTTNWAANEYVNQRELPIPVQLPDWNSWLPSVHPMDAFGTAFLSSDFNKIYSQIRASLKPGDAGSYTNYKYLLGQWSIAADGVFLPPYEAAASWTAASRQAVYSANLWNMVKLWEINQEFGLEGMPSAAFGAKANLRGWFTSKPFTVSPLQMHIPAGPGLANGTDVGAQYLGYIWYHTQLLLNDGNGSAFGQDPIDWNYTQNDVIRLATAAKTPLGNLELLWLIKALQEFTQQGSGPELGPRGFEPTEMSPITLVYPAFGINWVSTAPAARAAVTQAYLKVYFDKLQTFTAAQYAAGRGSLGAPWASPTEDPRTDDALTLFGGQIWFMLPRLRYLGVDSSLTGAISAWAAGLWPAGNWPLNDAATCRSLDSCTSD